MVSYRFKVTTTYLDGKTELYECDYLYSAYDKMYHCLVMPEETKHAIIREKMVFW